MILINIFLASLVVYYALRLYKKYNYRKHQLKLYRLRDKVRQYAIENKIDKKDWSFTYLDSSICKSVHTFGKVNMWYALYLMDKHKKDNRLAEFNPHLTIALKKNSSLKELHEEYAAIIMDYVYQRHIVFIVFAYMGLKSLLTSIAFFRHKRLFVTSSLKSLTTFPETSTSFENSWR